MHSLDKDPKHSKCKAHLWLMDSLTPGIGQYLTQPWLAVEEESELLCETTGVTQR